ncbi:MAG: ATP-binding protein [Flavobacteriales bacterium]|jgi:predicted AAA+ superfamily ATPase
MGFEILHEQSQRLLANTPMDFKRYLYNEVNWKNRLIGIKGARGTGKTTLVLQWIKAQNLSADMAIYLSLDDIYFSSNTLKSTIDEFYKLGGSVVALDEVHKYSNWSQEIKNIYDFYPSLKIIFTGSSIIDISKQQGDLSRRAVMYELNGLSYREYLSFIGIAEMPSFSLEDLLKENLNERSHWPKDFRPLQYFKEYLEFGYYPFVSEDMQSVHQRIRQMVRTIVESDMAELEEFDIRNAKKLLQLIFIIAQQVPFKPNISSLAAKTNIHRNTLGTYLYYLEQAKLISLLHETGNSVATLQKPDKIYMNNTTLLAALATEGYETGTLRETFFQSQLSSQYSLSAPKQGDFTVNGKFIFEIGGKGKTGTQLENKKNAWVVRDGVEYTTSTSIPLWMFGFLY